MTRAVKSPEHKNRHRRDDQSVIQPEGAFKRPHKLKVVTDRRPEQVTSINPEGMAPILPGMPYIPPA